MAGSCSHQLVQESVIDAVASDAFCLAPATPATGVVPRPASRPTAAITATTVYKPS
jgi:hypothetical protein